MSKRKQTAQHDETPTMDDATIEVTAGEWGMIIVTAFTGIALGPFALLPGAILIGMFTYRINPELMHATKAAQWVRGLLPAPTDDEDDEEQTTEPSTASTNNAPAKAESEIDALVSAATAANGAASVVQTTEAHSLLTAGAWLKLVNEYRDDMPHLIVLAPSGAGKTVLAQAIMAMRTGQRIIFDLKWKPGKWGGLDGIHLDDEGSFQPFTQAIIALRKEFRDRLKRLNAGDDQFEALHIVLDEYPTTVAAVPELGVLFIDLARMGRELNMRLIAMTTGDTVKAFGLEGQGDVRDNFGYIRLAKHAIKVLPACRAQERPACLEVLGEFQMIDTMHLLRLANVPQKKSLGWKSASDKHGDPLLEGLLSTVPERSESGTPERQRNDDGTALESDGTIRSIVPVTAQEASFITIQLVRNVAPSDIAKSMPGYNGRRYKEYTDKVMCVKAMMDA